MRDVSAEISILWSIESGNFGVIDGSVGKEFAHSAGDTGGPGSISGSGISPGGGKWQSTPIFLPKKSHGQRSLTGYSP